MAFLKMKLAFIGAVVVITIIGHCRTVWSHVNIQEEDPAVTNFRNYLKIETAQPNPQLGYRQAIEWLRNQAAELDLEFNFLDLRENDEFAIWMTWEGREPGLPSVLFNSHMDVVPADPSKWTYPPFEAFKDSRGNIFGRGTNDMKCATVATLEALRRLKQAGFQPLRTVHVMVMPDEEKGGFRGVRPFVETDAFKKLNVGVDIDEGGVNPESDTMAVWYAEKAVWEFNITAKGTAGHGSTLPQFTAGQRLAVVINKLLQFRTDQYNKLRNPGITVDQLTVVNLVQLGGGLAENTIPSEVWATFDMRIRITPEWNFTDVEAMLQDILEQAHLGSREDPDNQVVISYIAKTMETGETVTNHSNIWWTVVQNTCLELNVSCPAVVTNAATDGRYFRNIGIPVFGIGPFLNTPFTMHQDNEKINEIQFLQAIPRYMAFLQNLANTPAT